MGFVAELVLGSRLPRCGREGEKGVGGVCMGREKGFSETKTEQLCQGRVIEA